jgi:hypothetical protein
MQNPPFGRRPPAVIIALGSVLVTVALGDAHTYVGIEAPSIFRARLESPNATTADFPIPIPNTSLSVVCFKVRNSSPIDSRLTAIGLDLPGSLTGFTLISPTDTDFKLIEQVTNVPELPDVTLDFALVTGRTFAGGRPSQGLPPSQTPTTFCVSGPFPQTMPIERILDLGVVRMQAGGLEGEDGDILVWDSRPR